MNEITSDDGSISRDETIPAGPAPALDPDRLQKGMAAAFGPDADSADDADAFQSIVQRIGEDTGDKLVFDSCLTTRGGVFGQAFDALDVRELPWGQLELDLACNGGTATWTSTEEGFADGTLDLVRLTTLDGLTCTD